MTWADLKPGDVLFYDEANPISIFLTLYTKDDYAWFLDLLNGNLLSTVATDEPVINYGYTVIKRGDS